MKHKVAIVYPYFAHYREPIINELLKDKEIEYFFLSGDTLPKSVSSLKLAEINSQSRNKKLRNIWIFKYFLIQFDLIKFIRKNNINTLIFLADWKYISYWFYIFYCKLTHRKCFFWSHGLLNNKKTLNNRIKFLFHSLFDGGLIYSERSKKIMENWGFKKRLLVVNNSLNYEEQNNLFLNCSESSVNETSFLPFDIPYIIFTGRLIKERKLELLFKALVYLKENNTLVNLLILGTGPHEFFLKEQIEKLNLQNQVLMGGACYDEKILCKYFVNAEMCVFPGPIGLTIIHSMTYGTPVITNNNLDKQKPEVEALIDGYNGYLFNEDDSLDLAIKISKILNLSPIEKKKFEMNCLNSIKNNYTPKFQSRVIHSLVKS